jgi:UDP-glucuronate 4-epimerase
MARRVLVTGCAGFVGSHLSEALVRQGDDVVGVDCFTDYYARELKEANLARLREAAQFEFLERDLVADPVDGLLDGIDVIFHLAAQPGVRGSFGDTFEIYLRNNVQATQRLLGEAARRPIERFVYASSSSVYGNADRHPTTEAVDRAPVSPYGMTKAATEDLAGVYHRTCGVPVVGLRYFTAYGPRQRPDMAFTRFLTRAVRNEPLTILGDGRQIRDFTFVDDIVQGTIGAAGGVPGRVYNIGGGNPVALGDVVAMMGELLEHPLRVEYEHATMGDARHTSADCSLAAADFGYEAETPLSTGLLAQLEWVRAMVHAESAA